MYSNAVKQATIDFVGKYGHDISEAITDTGLFFPAVVAQKALESGWGKSELAAKYNNFGGIKNFGSLSSASGSVTMDTTENIGGRDKPVEQPFATFDTPLQSFQAYVNILKDPTKKYIQNGVFAATTPEEQIRRIAQAGYTTTPAEKYLNSMRGIIEACTDLYPYGKIESNSPNQTLQSLSTLSAGIGSSIASASASLSNYFKTNK